jgi:WD40 repeat protein
MLVAILFFLVAATFVSRVYSQPGLQIIKDLHRPSVSAAVWSPDGKRIATLSNLFNHVTIWDVEAGTIIREFDTPLQGCNCLRFTSDGNFIITPAEVRPETDRHAALILWNVSTGQRERDIPGPSPDKPMSNAARVFAVSRDARQLALSTNRMGAPLALYPEPDWATPILLDLETDHANEKDSATAMDFSPDGRQLAVGTAGNRGPGICGTRLYLFDLTNRKIIWRKQVFENDLCMIGAITFSPDGRFVAVGLGPSFNSRKRPDGTWEKIPVADPLLILDPATGDVVRMMPEATEKIWNMSWSQDGQILAATQNDRSIRFWSMSNPDQQPKRLGLSRSAMSISFAPEGLRFVATDETKATIGEISRQ